MAKPPKTINEQIEILLERGMEITDISSAKHFLANISYYRLKGYWWEMQIDTVDHEFKEDANFTDVIDLYNFDRHFRLIVFDAIERIEIALRTKLIYHLSLKHGAYWHQDLSLFNDYHEGTLNKIYNDIQDSKETFILEHYKNHKDEDPEAWKALEVVTLNTLSKIYHNLNNQDPVKSIIATEFGIYIHSDLSSWLRTITLIRNIIAHHSRLWNRVLINSYTWPKSTKYPLLTYEPTRDQRLKVFPILSAILYLNDRVTPGHSIKLKLIDLFKQFPKVQLYKMGFPNNWEQQPIWK